MSIEEIKDRLYYMAHSKEDADVLRAAIALLRTHPDAQPNEPLTFDELVDMSGKPVWVEFVDGTKPTWGVVLGMDIYFPLCTYCEAKREGFGESWKAYRRPPKEDQG